MAAELEGGWATLLRDLLDGRWAPRHLDAGQLVRHALLLHRRRDLVLLYWEPADGDDLPEVRAHRAEVARALECVGDARPGSARRRGPRCWTPGSRCSRPTSRRCAAGALRPTALVCSAFAPWRGRTAALTLGGLGPFDDLRLEERLLIPHGGGTPNLDVALTVGDALVGIESKAPSACSAPAGRSGTASAGQREVRVLDDAQERSGRGEDERGADPAADLDEAALGDGVFEPLVVPLSRQAQDPARHRDRHPGAGTGRGQFSEDESSQVRSQPKSGQIPYGAIVSAGLLFCT